MFFYCCGKRFYEKQDDMLGNAPPDGDVAIYIKFGRFTSRGSGPGTISPRNGASAKK